MSDTDGIETWFSENEKFQDKRFQIQKWTEKQYMSVKELVAQYLDKISTSTRDWLLESVNFDGKSVEVAIKAGVSLNSLKKLIAKVPIQEKLYVQENGKVGDFLSAALLYGDTVAVEYVLEYQFVKSHPLITPPTNQLLQSLADKGQVSNSDREKLLLLSKYQQGPILWVNKRTHQAELQGYQGLVIGPEIRAELTRSGLKDRYLQDWEAPSTNMNDVLTNLKSLADEFKHNYDSSKSYQNSCAEQTKKQLAIEPKFKDIRNYKQLVKQQHGNRAILARLVEVSPTLVDFFIQDLFAQQNSQDLDMVDEWIVSTSQGYVKNLLEKGDIAMPHQQNYLASRICEEYGEQELASALRRGWYVELTSRHFNTCRNHISDVPQFISAYERADYRVLSIVYSAIKDLQYAKALDALLQDSQTHGVQGGRDALALLLDRMIPFRTKVNADGFSLFELLLSHTSLTDVHFRRLNRLQLKYPTYYDNLAARYPVLKQVESYQVSDYISFL